MKKLPLLVALLISPLLAHATSTIDVTNNAGWGANIGWTNWRPDFDSTNTEGVVVGEFVCHGWIYGANVGWISMSRKDVMNNDVDPVNHIQYQNTLVTGQNDYGVNYVIDPTQPGVALLRGFGYGANIGWINFEATGNPRVSIFTGNLSGYAYSANCGWINLNDFDLGMVQRYVQTDHIAMGTDSNGNGIADAWEFLYFGGLLAPGQENSLGPNGNGMTILQDYQDGTNPFLANSGLRITNYSTNAGGVNSNITFTSTTARLYTIETNTDLTQALGWMDSGLGVFAPDAGPTTTRAVTQSSVVKRFFRVKTMRPLP